MSVLFIKIEDGIGDFVELGGAEFGVDRQTEDAAGEAFGDGKVSRAMAQLPADSHEMDRHRVMNGRADAGFFEMLAQFIAIIRLDDECMIDAKLAGRIEWTSEARTTGEPPAVSISI